MKRKVVYFAGILFLFQASACFAQSSTDLFLIELDGLNVVSSRNISDRDGYDNQPSFSHDSKMLLYTSIRSDNQADSYKYDIGSNTIERLFYTAPEAEYSPTVMPDGKRYSVIRVEVDGRQRLWSFPLNNEGVVSLLLPDVMPVGYHAWLDAKTVGMFILSDEESRRPVTFQIADITTGDVSTPAENIGRSIHKVPNEPAISITLIENESYTIAVYYPKLKELKKVIALRPDQEYYCWTPEGLLLTGDGSVIYSYLPGSENGWEEMIDLSSTGIKDISRIAMSANSKMFAVVSSRK